ncbi:MAG: BatA domain-containing protein, partial [Cyclobacteriaceae bacterium]
MSFLLPSFLIGLVGLALPLIIHLWSKKTKKAIWIGSIHFLRSTETKTMRSISPNQWLLLILRMVLLALVVFILADLHFSDRQKPTDTLVFIDVDLANEQWVENYISTLEGDFDVSFFAEGFPSWGSAPPNVVGDYWRLIEDAANISANKKVVISPLYQRSFVGKTSEISPEMTWIRPPFLEKSESLFKYSKEKSAFEITGTFDEWSTTFLRNEIFEDAPVIPVSYSLNGESGRLVDIFESAIKTLNELSPLTLIEDQNDPDWRIELGSQKRIGRKGGIFV